MDQCQLESSRFSRLFVTCTPVSTSNQTTKRRMISKSTSARRCASGMSRLGRSRSTRTPDEWLCHSSASRCSCMAEMPTPLHLHSPDFEQGHPTIRERKGEQGEGEGKDREKRRVKALLQCVHQASVWRASQGESTMTQTRQGILVLR